MSDEIHREIAELCQEKRRQWEAKNRKLPMIEIKTELQMPKCSAMTHQVGGDHYKSLQVQPVEYIHRNGLGFCEGNVVKLVTRWKSKGGIQDLEKAKHWIELLIDMENQSKLSP